MHDMFKNSIKQMYIKIKKQKESTDPNQYDNNEFNSIICINETEHKFYVYQQNGLLINRVDFSEQVQKYGSPLAVSSNGQNFIFRPNLDKRDFEEPHQRIEQMLKFNIMKLNIFGINWIKEINVLEGIKIQMQTRTRRNDWLSQISKMEADQLDKINISYLINDFLDICVQIKYDDSSSRQTYHYFENLL